MLIRFTSCCSYADLCDTVRQGPPQAVYIHAAIIRHPAAAQSRAEYWPCEFPVWPCKDLAKELAQVPFVQRDEFGPCPLRASLVVDLASAYSPSVVAPF